MPAVWDTWCSPGAFDRGCVRGRSGGLWLDAFAGYFVHSATLPPPKNLETVREFQRVQGGYALRWLESRLEGTT
jgi:hypothetical protein